MGCRVAAKRGSRSKAETSAKSASAKSEKETTETTKTEAVKATAKDLVIEDAVVVEDQPADKPKAKPAKSTSKEPAKNASTRSEPKGEKAKVIPKPESKPEPKPEVEAKAEVVKSHSPNVIPPSVPSSEPQQAGGLPLLIGGAGAALLGYVVAQVVPDGWPVTADSEITDALATADAKLATNLSGKADVAALDPIAAQLTDVASRLKTLTAQAEATTGQLRDMSARIEELEARPIVDLSSLDNSEALDAELASLRSQIAEVAAEAARQIEAAKTETTLLEQNATAAANAAARRAALSRVLAALDSGVPYQATLDEFAELADVEIPEALSASAADGIATLSRLQADFPSAARKALAAMRAENAGGENTISNYLRNQFGVRSLEPLEGDAPDAILSRIEASLTAGRLQDALAEADTLPEAGAAELAAWSEMARARIDALAAADALTQSQTSN